MRVLVIGFAESDRNGGAATLIDLTNALAENNAEVDFFSIFGSVSRFLYRKKILDHTVERYVIPLYCFEYRNLPFSFLKKSVLFLFSSIFFWNKRKLLDYDVIIDGVGLDYEALLFLKQYNVKVLRNHAGSPDAFYNFFLKDCYSLFDKKEKELVYFKYLSRYSGAIFQDQEHADAAKNIIKNHISTVKETPFKSFVIHPSVSRKFHDYLDCNKAVLRVSKSLNLIMVGTVCERKSQHKALFLVKELLAKGVNVRLDVFGGFSSDAYKQLIDSDVRNFGLEEYVCFKGFSQNYIDELYKADALITVSSSEGIPRSVRESLALDTPIVGFKFGGICLDIEKKLGGFFTKQDDFDLLIKFLSDADFSSKFKARGCYDLLFSRDKYIENIMELVTYK